MEHCLVPSHSFLEGDGHVAFLRKEQELEPQHMLGMASLFLLCYNSQQPAQASFPHQATSTHRSGQSSEQLYQSTLFLNIPKLQTSSPFGFGFFSLPQHNTRLSAAFLPLLIVRKTTGKENSQIKLLTQMQR